MLGHHSGHNEHCLHLSAKEIGKGLHRAAIGNVNNVDACHHLEQFAGHVRCAAISDRRVVEFARIGLRMGCELQKGRRWKKWVQH